MLYDCITNITPIIIYYLVVLNNYSTLIVFISRHSFVEQLQCTSTRYGNKYCWWVATKRQSKTWCIANINGMQMCTFHPTNVLVKSTFATLSLLSIKMSITTNTNRQTTLHFLYDFSLGKPFLAILRSFSCKLPIVKPCWACPFVRIKGREVA